MAGRELLLTAEPAKLIQSHLGQKKELFVRDTMAHRRR